MSLFKYRLHFIFIFFLAELPLQADVIDIRDISDTFISDQILFYRDPTAALTLQEIENSELSFEKNNKLYPSFGYTDDAIWGYFDAVNSDPEPKTIYLYIENFRLEEVRIYVRPTKGKNQTEEFHPEMEFL
ncbi:MAG: hypothetical protein OEZ34_05160 [Spirochaetia bacterium]|nr:hypothetical protein [Spirochaetia bacterium]